MAYRRTADRHACHARRGGVYLLVLGMGSLLTVIGFAVAVSSRINIRNAVADNNCLEAGVLASSALDFALASANSDAGWRANGGCNVWNAPISMGNGSMTWRQTDEIDNDMENNPDQPVRFSGEASVGGSARRFSLLGSPGGTKPLPVLSRTLHSETSITVTASLTSSGGAISCDGTLTNSQSITGNVEAATINNTGSIVGFVTQPSPNKTVPGISAAVDYASRATEISYWSIGSGKISATILSTATNPYGPQNASGIYLIRVPSGRTLEISESIIQATLLVELNGTARLDVRNKVAWEPPSTGMPSLIAVGSSSASVRIRPETGTVDVPLLGVGLFGIVIVIGTRATAPSELHGLFHIMGSAPTTFEQSPRIYGTWICNGAVTVSSATQFVANPNIAANPPRGYTEVDASVTAVPGSFRWDPR